jgi:hypothetical protein
MKRLLCMTMLLLMVLPALPREARAIEGLRGATWGQLDYEIPKEGKENLVLDGWIKQGVDWVKWGDTSINTYAKLRFKWDTEGYDWNNLLGPTVGISLDTYVPSGLALSLGFEYSWESRLMSDSKVMDQKAMAYVNWYGWWDLLQ